LLPATVITYILIVAPILARTQARVIKAFRPQVLIDDDSFQKLVYEASRLNPAGEVIALTAGVVFGLWPSQTWLADADIFWLKLCLTLSSCLLFGLLGWTIYISVAGTRLAAQLHRQPLRIGIFDISPFEPIGRQSLTMALVFVGGIVLGIVFGVGQQGFYVWQNWLILSLLALIPVLVFFLSMRDTHRVLVAEKRRELEAVQHRILQTCRTLMQRIDDQEDTGVLGAEINGLIAYEKRLQSTRTWPYNTATLRTLFFSVILPGGAALARIVVEILFE
jgi:hypothetical protein